MAQTPDPSDLHELGQRSKKLKRLRAEVELLDRHGRREAIAPRMAAHFYEFEKLAQELGVREGVLNLLDQRGADITFLRSRHTFN